MDLIALVVVGRIIYRYVYAAQVEHCSEKDVADAMNVVDNDSPVSKLKSHDENRTQSSTRRVEKSLLRKKYSPKNVPDYDIDTIVIGSGMGGLSCAAVLGRLGYKVLVLEQHYDVAGAMIIIIILMIHRLHLMQFHCYAAYRRWWHSSIQPQRIYL